MMYFIIGIFTSDGPNQDIYEKIGEEPGGDKYFAWGNLLIALVEIYLVLFSIDSEMLYCFKIAGVILIFDAVEALFNVIQRVVVHRYVHVYSWIDPPIITWPHNESLIGCSRFYVHVVACTAYLTALFIIG